MATTANSFNDTRLEKFKHVTSPTDNDGDIAITDDLNCTKTTTMGLT